MSKRNPEFPIGERVLKHAGVRLCGTVIAPLPLSECNDGTYKSAEDGEVCVKWDDGTNGYVKPQWIVKVGRGSVDIGGAK